MGKKTIFAIEKWKTTAAAQLCKFAPFHRAHSPSSSAPLPEAGGLKLPHVVYRLLAAAVVVVPEPLALHPGHGVGAPVHEDAHLGLVVPDRQRPAVQAGPVGGVALEARHGEEEKEEEEEEGCWGGQLQHMQPDRPSFVLSVGLLWCRDEHIGAYWSNTGPILEQYWSNIGAMLEQYWSNIEAILDRQVAVCFLHHIEFEVSYFRFSLFYSQCSFTQMQS